MENTKNNIFENVVWREYDEKKPGGLELSALLLRKSHLIQGKILDIGCGSGSTMNYFKNQGFDVYGIEKSEILIQDAKKRDEHLDIRWGTGENIEFDNDYFDGIICECAMSIFDQRQKVLNECYRVMKQGAKLIISDLYHIKGIGQDLPNLEEWNETFENRGFEQYDFCERTQDLKSFVMEWLWSGRNMEDICIFSEQMDSKDLGYFGMVLQKK